MKHSYTPLTQRLTGQQQHQSSTSLSLQERNICMPPQPKSQAQQSVSALTAHVTNDIKQSLTAHCSCREHARTRTRSSSHPPITTSQRSKRYTLLTSSICSMLQARTQSLCSRVCSQPTIAIELPRQKEMQHHLKQARQSVEQSS